MIYLAYRVVSAAGVARSKNTPPPGALVCREYTDDEYHETKRNARGSVCAGPVVFECDEGAKWTIARRKLREAAA